ncbi:class I SAM-dependent methyltransferase [soil metagenome]
MIPSNSLSTSYDRVAADYTAHIADELAGKPLDRALLHAFAEQVGTLGPVADLGCGPGHVAAFLAMCGAQVEGFDLSAGMITQAHHRYPALTFHQGDMRSLAVADARFGGITAFYSIIHLSEHELASTFQEWWRVLRPSGSVLVAFHIGESVVHLDEWWQHSVDLDFRFLSVDRVTAALLEAQFTIEVVIQRAPYPDVEHQSQRGYILARKVFLPLSN